MLCNAEPLFKTGSPRLNMKSNILHVGFGTKGTFSSPLNPNTSFVLEVLKKKTAQKTPDTFCSGTRTIQGNAMK